MRDGFKEGISADFEHPKNIFLFRNVHAYRLYEFTCRKVYVQLITKGLQSMNSSDRRPAGSLRGKVAVVTGASRGAGRGIALALGEAL